MGNEQPHHEGQQAEGGEVQVKAGGQPLQVGIIAGRLQLQARRNVARQWPVTVAEQPRQLPGGIEQGLRLADVDHHHTRCQLRMQGKRRQYLPVHRGQLLAGLAPQLAQRVRAHPRLPRRAHERLQVKTLHIGAGNGHARQQAKRLDPYQAQRNLRRCSQAQAPFQHRCYRPAQPAQLHIQRLVEALPRACHQLRAGRPGEHRAGLCVVVARLGVERLNAGPQGRVQPQTGEDADALQPVAPPMAAQGLHGDP
ncbi:hypothetical protein D3C73_981070 [compost metagenome]